jgi:hypothetical protein
MRNALFLEVVRGEFVPLASAQKRFRFKVAILRRASNRNRYVGRKDLPPKKEQAQLRQDDTG